MRIPRIFSFSSTFPSREGIFTEIQRFSAAGRFHSAGERKGGNGKFRSDEGDETVELAAYLNDARPPLIGMRQASMSEGVRYEKADSCSATLM
jgi:hypothetical protein